MKKREGKEIGKRDNKGQVNMSFGMIFSIILIIAFLAFGFYAIKTFLAFQDKVTEGKFYSDLQADITSKYGSAFSSQNFTYSLPSSVKFVCIADFGSSAKGSNSSIYGDIRRAYTGNENIFFYPVGFNGYQAKALNYLNMSGIVSADNPYCIKTANGKVSVVLKKGYNEALVTISRK